MADQPTSPTPPASSPNANRITAMIQDLAAQRAAPPANLPTPAVVPPQRPTMPPPAPRDVPIPPRVQAPPPPPPLVPVPPKPRETYSGELRTMSADIGNIKVGQAPAPVRPSTPSIPGAPSVPVPPPAAAPAIVIPQGTMGSGSMRKLVYGIGAAIVVIVVIYGIISLMSGGTPAETPTPSPSASVTPTSTSKNLQSYFGNPGTTINLANPSTGQDDFLNALVAVQPAVKQATVLAINHGGAPATLLQFLNDVTIPMPQDLSTALASDWVALAYGQNEQFDTNGAAITNPSVGTRLVIIAELTDATAANQAMQAWEAAGMASASSGLFQYDVSKHLVSTFSSGTYRQISVRYWNFPYADRSLDYAIVTASDNKNYLVLSGSRESLFFAIDQLMQ